MPRFRQTAQILRLMSQKECIRNIGIVAHIDHGKTTVADSLLAEAGLLSSQVAGKARALDYLEEEQKRGITIKTANVSLIHETEGQPYLVNLMDTPGHVDFTGKVTRALRAIDGVIVVVDAVEEIMAQTETVTRQALQERVKPLLFINKVDRLITEQKLHENEIQDKFARIVRDFNSLIEIYAEPELKRKWKVNPAKDTTAFGSALHRWGFTLSMTQSKGLKFADIVEAYAKEKQKTLSRLLPLSDAIFDMAVRSSPSPLEAQAYRMSRIWKGKLNSDVGRAMLNCDENGPATMCVTNVQTGTNNGLIATGRLFSGSIAEGDEIHLINADVTASVKQVSLYMSAYLEKVNKITAGNIAALTGLNAARAGETLVHPNCRDEMLPFENLRYFSEPVVTVAIEPDNTEDLTRIAESMKRLAIEDPNLAVTFNERTGEYLLSGIGELHLETALATLRDYSGKAEIAVSKPAVDYRETITRKGSVVMAKSPNKQNSFWVQIQPAKGKPKNAWNMDEHGNTLAGSTKSIRHLDEAKDSVIQGFGWACKNGPLCEQPMANVQVDLINAQLHDDPSMREGTQVSRAVGRAILGSFLTAEPVLLEPIYRIEVRTPTQLIGKCLSIITGRRGKVRTTQNRGLLTVIIGYVPVAETFGLTTELRSATSGRVFWQSTFHQWKAVPEKLASTIIEEIRREKGLPPDIPKPEKFIDKTVNDKHK